MGVLTLGHGTVCFVSLELGALVVPLRLCEELCCHPGGGAGVWLSRSSLRCYCLPPVLCGSGTGPGLSRAHSLRHSLLTTWSLVLGPGFHVRSSTLRRLPMRCHGWGFVYVSTF